MRRHSWAAHQRQSAVDKVTLLSSKTSGSCSVVAEMAPRWKIDSVVAPSLSSHSSKLSGSMMPAILCFPRLRRFSSLSTRSHI